VVGIIAAFSKISTTGSGGLGSVAGGISEALVVTALGLLIAIPAVLLFNSLSARVERISQGLTTAMGQFIDHLEFGKAPAANGKVAVTPPENGSRGAVADAQLA
jgi:biopolymer transport protein ExbB